MAPGLEARYRGAVIQSSSAFARMKLDRAFPRTAPPPGFETAGDGRALPAAQAR